MNTVADVMSELKHKGSEKTRAIYARHGIGIPMFGVSIADLKMIAKKIKGNQQLALALHETGNYDAMYLAAIIADGTQMTRPQLQRWAKAADACETLAGSTVPAIVAESRFARELAMKWIDSTSPALAVCGWGAYGGIVATVPDEGLDLVEIRGLLERIVREIDGAPNKVRYMMNAFVIAVGGYVKPLNKAAKAAAKSLGAVSVDMGDTACKVPSALAYIAKIEAMGRLGKKRKTMRC